MITKRKIVLFAFILTISTLLIAPVSYATPPTQPILSGPQWAVYNSDKTTHATTIPSGGVQFQFSDATSSTPAYTRYMLDTFTAELTTGDTLAATFSVVATGSALFVGNPNGGCPGSSSSLCPGAVRLFFQSNLAVAGVDSGSCVGPGFNEYNYWWSNTGSSDSYYQFTSGGSSGLVTLSVSLDPANWSDLCGHSGTYNSAATAGFNSAIGNIKRVGLSFGSGYFFANGVGVDGTTGSAVFMLTAYTIG